VFDKLFPEFLGVAVDVFGHEESNHDPNLVGHQHDISMLGISMSKSIKKVTHCKLPIGLDNPLRANPGVLIKKYIFVPILP